MINIIVSGGFGRMGSKVVNTVKEEPDMSVIAIVEKKENREIDGVMVTDKLESVIDRANIVVEFSSPEATIEHTKICKEHKMAMVIGTTGLSESQMRFVKKSSAFIPILISPNMSWGANVMVETSKMLKGMLKGYDVEIVEFHHKFKKDSPSGTAKLLLDNIKEDDTKVVYGRSGFSPRGDNEIGVHSIRGGNVIGEHKVIWSGMGERIELSHIVWDRVAFAYGTIRAIKFIANKNKGLYDLRSIFNKGEKS